MTRGVVLIVAAAALFLAALLAWNTVRQERAFRRFIAAGDEALATGRTFDAIEAFSGALALKNGSMLAHLKRGDSYRRHGELTAALRDLRDAVALDASAPRPLELLGDVNLAMGRHARAAEAYARSVALDERAPRVFYKLGLAHYRLGELPRAVDALRRALSLDERLAAAHALLGVCLRDLHQVPDALVALRRAVEVDPSLSTAREELADVYLSLGRHRDRIDQLEALAALEPARAGRQVAVAMAYARAGRADVALESLRHAAERHPDEMLIPAAMGRIWLDASETRGDRLALQRAIAVLGPAAEGPGATSDVLQVYGRALLLAGRADAAERTLQRATARLPIDPAALLLLERAARQRGHADAARDARSRYVAIAGEDAISGDRR